MTKTHIIETNASRLRIESLTIASLFLNIYNIPLIYIDNIFIKKVKLGSKGHTTEIESKDL